MTPALSWRVKLAEADQACRDALASSPLRAITEKVLSSSAPELIQPAQCFALLDVVSFDPASTARIASLKASIASETGDFERWLMVQAALTAFPRVERAAVADGVKLLWADDVLFVACNPASLPAAFSMDHVRFRELAKLITWRRFPAGQFHWELGAFPKFCLKKTSPADLIRVLSFWARHLRGFSPFWEIHVNDRRKNRMTLSEAEGIKSYELMAQSLELQPDVLGIVSSSWLFCASTGNITPRLAWLRDFLVTNGAIAADCGPAPADSGFLVGSEDRRRLYEEGSYRPASTLVIWPRSAILRWASRYRQTRLTSEAGA